MKLAVLFVFHSFMHDRQSSKLFMVEEDSLFVLLFWCYFYTRICRDNNFRV